MHKAIWSDFTARCLINRLLPLSHAFCLLLFANFLFFLFTLFLLWLLPFSQPPSVSPLSFKRLSCFSPRSFLLHTPSFSLSAIFLRVIVLVWLWLTPPPPQRPTLQQRLSFLCLCRVDPFFVHNKIQLQENLGKPSGIRWNYTNGSCSAHWWNIHNPGCKECALQSRNW